MSLRFARFAAVSTKEQAAGDKFSIPTQLERTLAFAREKGWQETAGPFVIPGQSRTKYINLSDAEAEIIPLRQMLEAARHNRFDVLVLAEFDRLRELLDPVFRTLALYHIQLYSLNQQIDPIEPQHYDQYASDTVAMLIGLSSITSRAEISRFRRKWREQMPKRVTERGLPATHISWGYRKPPGQEESRKAVPEQNPELTHHILTMRDMLLAGRSIRQILDYLKSNGVPPPRGSRWYPQTVRDILRNPFYAGWVMWGKSRIFLDPYGQRRRNRHIPLSEIERARGRHEPLWDDETHRRLVAELRRRTKNYRGRKNNQFTGLVKCGICQAPMWRQGNGPRADRLIWRCSADRDHPPILHSKLLDQVGQELLPALQPFRQKRQASLPLPSRQSRLERLEEEKEEVESELERLEIAYLKKKFSLDRYAHHKARLDEQLVDVEERIAQAMQSNSDQENRTQLLQEMRDTPGLAEWLKTEDPLRVNRRLQLLLEKVVVKGDEIEIIFRD